MRAKNLTQSALLLHRIGGWLSAVMSRFSIFGQATVLTLMIGAVTVTAIAYGYRESVRVLLDHEKTDLQEETEILARKIQNLNLLSQTLALDPSLRDRLERDTNVEAQQAVLEEWLLKHRRDSDDGVIVSIEYLTPGHGSGAQFRNWNRPWHSFTATKRRDELLKFYDQTEAVLPPESHLRLTLDKPFECDLVNVEMSGPDAEDSGIPVLAVLARLPGVRDAFVRLQVDLRKLKLNQSPRAIVLLFKPDSDGASGPCIFPRGIDIAEMFPDVPFKHHASSANDRFQDDVELEDNANLATQLGEHYFVVSKFKGVRADDLENDLLKWRDRNKAHQAKITRTTDPNFAGQDRVVISAAQRDVIASGKAILDEFCTPYVGITRTTRQVIRYVPIPLDGASDSEGTSWEPQIGVIRISSANEMEGDIREELYPSFRALTIAVGAGYCLLLLGAWWVGSRLSELEESARRVKAGEYVPVRVSHANRESSELSTAFNEMVDEINRKEQELERRVERRTKELDKARKLRERFLDQVNHDLRSPLMAIEGAVRQLRRLGLNPAQQQRVNMISGNAERIQRLVNDIREYQEILQGRVEPTLTEFSIREVLDQIARDVETRAQQNNVTLKMEIEPDLPPMYSDRHWLLRILGNLVGNACKFTRNGEVRCIVRTEAGAEDPWLIIEVTDTGRGMSPDEQRKLFRPYEKIASKSENPDGTGLGLVICRGFCEALYGSVLVDPERTALGRGTTFVVRLPMRHATARPIDSAKSTLVAEFPVFCSNRNLALLIDDDLDVCSVMSECLREHGFDVLQAHDGESGLALARDRRPTLITLDVQLPKLDGWRVLNELKKNPATADIPVIMVTVFNNPRKGFALGAADFVNKPVNWDYFGRIVEKYRCSTDRGRVLIVEDDAACRELLAEELEERNWEVMQAEHGRAALEQLIDFRPDVILLDLNMPVMDGFDFVAALRADPELQHLPVIVLTGENLDQREQDWLRGRVGQVIDKHHQNWDELRAEIVQLVERITGAATLS